MAAYEIPKGWTMEPIPDAECFLIAAGTLMVTVDFRRRCARAGLTSFGRTISARKYVGHGWRKVLVRDAVEWLTGIANRP